MQENRHRIGWIGMGRMGFPMAERLVKGGHDVHVWNRTRAKAEPLAAKGATLVERPSDLADVDILFTMVSTGKDLEEVLFRRGRRDRRRARDRCRASSSTAPRSASTRRRRSARGSAALGAEFLAAPVSGNGKCVKAGKLSVRRLRPGERLRGGEAVSRDDRAAGRRLCRRGGARAHLQDRPQRACSASSSRTSSRSRCSPRRPACRATPSWSS